MNPSPFLTVPELADYLRIGRTSAYQLARTKGFPVVKVGRAIRIPREALMAWLSRFDSGDHAR